MRWREIDRDDEIGAAIRSLPARRAGPDFFTNLRNALEEQPPEWSTSGRAWRPGRRRRVVLLAATATISALAGALTTVSVYAAGRDQAEAEAPSSVTTFEPIEGWNIVLTTIDPNNPQDLPIVWTANVPFAPEESTSGFPDNTVESLPPNGIVMTVVGPREYTGDTVFPPARFPLTISQGFCNHDQYEGQPAPHVSGCLIDTKVEDQLLNVTVWFGTNRPSEDLYQEADAQLSRLVVAGQ